MRGLNNASHTRTLFGDTLRVSVLTAIARAPGLARIVVLATVAGPGALLDSWLLAFRVPSFASHVFLVAISPALVPGIADLRSNALLGMEAIFVSNASARVMARIAIGAAILTPILDFALLPRFGVAGVALARAFILAIIMAALSFAVFQSKPRVLAAVGAS
jgi:peptidoglycan biosynthesis protein MviN/MurJ (putative lipid II flippase)